MTRAWLAAVAPYLWLAVFFAFPFLLVAKLSMSHTVLAMPPYAPQLDLSQGDWIINPGGVGQPRDGDPRAAWLLLDLENWRASWRRVEYPIDDAARAIQKAGLPVALSDRLYHGQ